jgi:GNAT superfamily N-acetyltransferase
MIQPLTRERLDAAIALLEVADLAGAKTNLVRYLRCQPRCGWVALDGDQLVGLVTVLRQGTAGFVGAMAVHPAHRNIGLGRRLLVHAQEDARRDGMETFLLEATPMGAHLYTKLGYVEEHTTVILTRDNVTPPPSTRIAASTHAALAQLDRLATGTVRDDMLADLLADNPPGATEYRNGELVGAAMLVGERLGPVFATDRDAGDALFAQLAPAARVVVLPEPNSAALAAAARHGFTEHRRLRRMRLGPAIAMRLDCLWALASPGAG